MPSLRLTPNASRPVPHESRVRAVTKGTLFSSTIRFSPRDGTEDSGRESKRSGSDRFTTLPVVVPFPRARVRAFNLSGIHDRSEYRLRERRFGRFVGNKKHGRLASGFGRPRDPLAGTE